MKGLTVRSIDGVLKLDDVSFTANSGEILGIAGISGCGQKELLEAIAGLQPRGSGSIRYIEDDGATGGADRQGPPGHRRHGRVLSFVPEDRLGMGLVGTMDLTDNMMLRSFRRGSGVFTDRKSPRLWPSRWCKELDVATPSVSTPVRRLSGGNVQKVLVGREIASAPTVLLTAYAVRGLDINSSYTIYDLLNGAEKARAWPWSTWARTWTCCWSCATGSWCSAAARSAASWTAGAPESEQLGMLMTRLGGKLPMNKQSKPPMFHMSKRRPCPGTGLGHPRRAILLALVACAVVTTLLTGENPIQVYVTMFEGAFGTARKTWITVQNLAILLCISLAVTPAFKMRFWNIGAEGQVLAGGLATAACMISWRTSCPTGCSSASWCRQHRRRGRLGPHPRLLQGQVEHQRDPLHPDDELRGHPAGGLLRHRLGGAQGRRQDRHHQPEHRAGLAAPVCGSKYLLSIVVVAIAHHRHVPVPQVHQARL